MKPFFELGNPKILDCLYLIIRYMTSEFEVIPVEGLSRVWLSIKLVVEIPGRANEVIFFVEKSVLKSF